MLSVQPAEHMMISVIMPCRNGIWVMAVLPEFLQFVDPNSGVIHRFTFFGESFEDIFDMMHCNMIFDTT